MHLPDEELDKLPTEVTLTGRLTLCHIPKNLQSDIIREDNGWTESFLSSYGHLILHYSAPTCYNVPKKKKKKEKDLFNILYNTKEWLIFLLKAACVYLFPIQHSVDFFITLT